MDTQLQSISKIFTEKLYRIPDYQRGYAWLEKQLKDFWNDIHQLEENKNHYVGVLTLEKVPSEIYNTWQDDKWIIAKKSFEPYYVVDGQQRLTTIIILIQAITEIFNKRETLNFSTIDEIKKRYLFDSKDNGVSRSYIFGYEKDNPSNEFLKTKVFLENSSSAYHKEETIYTQNLLFAKDFFKSKLKDLEKSEVEDIFRKITQSFMFNIYSMSSEIDVFVAFEAMNNRGKPLSNLELLKNRLIYLSTKFHAADYEKEALRRKINDTWKAVYHYLGRNKDKPLDDDFFLINHCIIYFGHEMGSNERMIFMRARRIGSIYRDSYEVFLLEKTFSLKNLYEKKDSGKFKLTVQDIDAYIQNLSKSVEIWFSMNNPTLSKDYSEEEQILLEKIYRISATNYSALLLACLLKKTTKTTRIKFLSTLERYAFIIVFASHRVPIYGEGFTELTIQLSKDEITLPELEKKLLEKVDKIVNDVDVMNDIIKRFISEGFYNWTGIKYFLYEYDLDLKGASKTKKTKIDWVEFSQELEDYVSVEHIYPQTPKLDCWKKDFDQYSLKERRAMLNSLGNLLPLSKAKNSSLQNKCFLDKIDNDVNQVGYRYGSYSENVVSKFKEWTPQHILDRGLLMLDFMEKRWQISLGDIEKKTKMLNLSFLNQKVQ